MTRYALITEPRADDDVGATVRWYERQRPGLGLEFLGELRAAYMRIVAGPLGYRDMDRGTRRALLRRFPYAVYFVVGDDIVAVVAVLHASRDPAEWQGRRGDESIPHMSAPDPNEEIERFLAHLETDGRSSPSGMAWQRFFKLLESNRQAGGQPPPVPLILAASGESDRSKHQRLGAQLRWASENGCLDAALRHLRLIPVDQWNRNRLDRWDQESYWEP